MPILNYPPEIVDACVTMQRAATNLNQEMDQLRVQVSNLVGTSSGEAVRAFNDVQRLWEQTGLAHNQTLADVARAAGASYDEMTAFDSYLAQQLG